MPQVVAVGLVRLVFVDALANSHLKQWSDTSLCRVRLCHRLALVAFGSHPDTFYVLPQKGSLP